MAKIPAVGGTKDGTGQTLETADTALGNGRAVRRQPYLSMRTPLHSSLNKRGDVITTTGFSLFVIDATR